MGKKGIYAKYLSREYKEAWNEIWKKHNGVEYFKNLDGGNDERETKNKL
jgi:hypothetical protein